MGRFYTSDWHLNERRITPEFNPFFRDFKSVEEQNEYIIQKCNEHVGEDDELWHLGDVAIDVEGLKWMDKLRCKNRHLIVGNYDNDKLYELGAYFCSMQRTSVVTIDDVQYKLNHYPIEADSTMMNIVGHIHGLWKVQPGIINVGVDAWNFRPLSDKDIAFLRIAICKYYDENVFPLQADLDSKRQEMLSEDFKKWKGN